MSGRNPIVAIMLALAAGPALAWSNDGHRIVCEIAWQRMNAETRGAVREILSVGGDGKFHEACLWMDRVRDDSRYRDLKPLHYMNFPEGSALEEIGPHCSADGCARSAIAEQREILGASSDPAERLLALRILLHVVGDIHQPLHCGYGADAGGNGTKVAFFGAQTVRYGKTEYPMNLHTVWDSMILGRAGLEWEAYAATLGESIDATDSARWAVDDVDRWIREAYRIVETVVYDLPENRDLRDAYYTRGLAAVDTQLRKAGVRLALVLNTELN